MADIKQLKIKIHSTKNIKKITNAMEIISTIKLQKVKKHTESLRRYMIEFLGMLSAIDGYTTLFPASSQTDNAKELIILVWSEKWLCGSLNTLLFKQFHAQYESKQGAVVLFTIGKKAKEFAFKRGYDVIGDCSLRDVFESDDLRPLYDVLGDAYEHKRYARITVYYNYFKNTMKQIPVGLDLMPLSMETCDRFMRELDIVLPSKVSTRTYNATHIELEPDRETIVKKAYEIMMRIIVYGAVLHNKTGEFAARMLAMKWAKDNATSIISWLTLAYNKARQDAITKEVLEIVSAKAVIED